jgi:hypothetical protein
MQGFPSSTTTAVFWGAADLLAGPLLGLSDFWIKTGVICWQRPESVL